MLSGSGTDTKLTVVRRYFKQVGAFRQCHEKQRLHLHTCCTLIAAMASPTARPQFSEMEGNSSAQ